MTRFSGKVVIVTGGASGIGAATAARFAAEGAAVTVADRNEPASLPPGAIFVKVDVTDEAQVIAMVEETVAQRGKLDCIVNNAGIGAAMPTAMLPRESWEQVFAVNSTGVFLCARAAFERTPVGLNHGLARPHRLLKGADACHAFGDGAELALDAQRQVAPRGLQRLFGALEFGNRLP